MIKYITYLDSLETYEDRFYQIHSSIPDEVEAIVFTKKMGKVLASKSNVKIVALGNSFFSRSIFLKLKLAYLVLKEALSSKVILQDWFKSFLLVSIISKAIPSFKIVVVYSPVISDFGWIYKRVFKLAPSVGMRYDWIRARECVQDFLICKLCDMLVVQSKELIEFYKKAYFLRNKRIDFNYNDYRAQSEIDVLGYEEAGDKIKVGFLGNLERHKGISELLSLAGSLPENFELYIAGEVRGKENSKIVQELINLPNVVYLGRLSKNEIPGFFSQIQCLVLFSYHEGSPRVIREFLDKGKAIFVYDNPGIDYCRYIEGVYIYSYGDISKAVEDITHHDYRIRYRRDLPEDMRKSNLENVLSNLIVQFAN